MTSADNPFQVMGATVPKMLGRDTTYKSLVDGLSKPTPDHISVVGPRMYGKTVLLRHLADNLANPAYVAIVYWDLGHETPDSDADFKQRFARVLYEALKRAQVDEAAYLADGSDDAGEQLRGAFEDLEDRGARVLVIMDGFDRILAKSNITRSLWDFMRSLGTLTSVRMVTASRLPLQDLCRTEDARTSDFWNIFNPILTQVTCLTTEDLEAFLSALQARGFVIKSDALETIEQHTGGIPVLTAALLNEVFEQSRGQREVSRAVVKNMSDYVGQHYDKSVLDGLLIDIPTNLQVILSDMAQKPNGLPKEVIGHADTRTLASRGFIHEASNGHLLVKPRILRMHVQKQNRGVSDIGRLFGEADQYDNSIGRVLELRLRQYQGADSRLTQRVERMLDDLLHYPEATLSNARGIRDVALDLIWDAEIGPGKRTIPGRWKVGSPIFNDPFPSASRGRQCALLREATGTQATQRPLTRHASKHTSILLDQISSAGDLENHRTDDEPHPYGFLVAVCTAAVELCGSLTRDLGRSN